MAEAASDAANPLTWAHSGLARNPQPTYELLRANAGDALRVDGLGVLVLSRTLVDEVLRQPDLYSSALTTGHLKSERPLIPLEVDPPDHQTYRKILSPEFSPRRMQDLEPSITSLANGLIDDLATRDEIDFAKDFSVPFPSQVFLTMLGLPLTDLPELLAMKDGIIRPHVIVGQPLGHPDSEAHQAATARSIYEYFGRVLRERERDRDQASGDDLLSYFLHSEIDGVRLSHEDILDISFLFLVAGLDTVSASLDCFFAYLAEHPERRQELVDDPSIVPAVVEELLRWETPVMIVPRVAARDAELGTVPVAAGDRIFVMIGSANTDVDDDLDDPGDVRWDRESNRHLAFGGGIHRCLGSHLARIELRIALEEWHARIPHYTIKPGAELEFANGVRAVDSFPMLLSGAR